MPDRRHLWRGIHDPEMVRSGVAITLATDRQHYRPDDEVRARLAVGNTGVGHHFPTYVTPRVVVRMALVDMHGQELRGSAEEHLSGVMSASISRASGRTTGSQPVADSRSSIADASNGRQASVFVRW